MKKTLRNMLALLAAVTPAIVAISVSADPTTQPAATQPSKKIAARKLDQGVIKSFLNDFNPVAQKLMPLARDRDTWSDTAKRTAAAAKLQPDLKKAVDLIDDMAAKNHLPEAQAVGAAPMFLNLAAIYGDDSVQKQLLEMAAKPESEGSIAKASLLDAKYWNAGKDAAAQTKVLDSFEDLVKDDPKSKDVVAYDEVEFYDAKPSSEIADRLDAYVTNKLHNPSIAQMKAKAKVDVMAEDFKKAGSDADAQGKALDAMEEYAKSDPNAKVAVAYAETEIYKTKPSKEISDRIDSYVTTKLKMPMIAQAKMMMAAEETQKSLVGKPMVLAGILRDGTHFTTEDMKGKVILVDFWASWCGPCKAELPRVKKEYADMHDKGLEVIGISLDQKGSDLSKFLEQNPDMPWPQLFDPKHPYFDSELAKANGIVAIPTMFLIDKNGVCRSVTAREDFEKMIPKLLAEKSAL